MKNDDNVPRPNWCVETFTTYMYRANSLKRLTKSYCNQKIINFCFVTTCFDSDFTACKNIKTLNLHPFTDKWSWQLSCCLTGVQNVHTHRCMCLQWIIKIVYVVDDCWNIIHNTLGRYSLVDVKIDLGRINYVMISSKHF